MNDVNKPPMKWAEIAAEGLAAFVLSIAALLTSWASFQAALWDGEQAAAYTQAGTARVQAGVLATKNGQIEAIDMFLFTQWLDALAEHKRDLQDFYRARFRPEFEGPFEAWLKMDPKNNPSAPPTPFALKEYHTHFAREARSMDAKADALFEKGQHANEISDAFVQATVILALALFTGGIGQTFKREALRMFMSGLAGVACVIGFISLLSLPALKL